MRVPVSEVVAARPGVQVDVQGGGKLWLKPNALLVAVPGIGHWTLNWNPRPGCLLAATTAFIQAGRPASPAPWHSCTRALADEPTPFPAAP